MSAPPERSAGGRLCRVVLGLDVAPYLALYARVNLCAQRWNAREAAGERPKSSSVTSP